MAVALFGGLAGVLRLLDLGNQQLKSLADVLVISCTRFSPAALDLFRHLLAILRGDLALLGTEIALVADNDDGNGLGALWKRRWLRSATLFFDLLLMESGHLPGGSESFRG